MPRQTLQRIKIGNMLSPETVCITGPGCRPQAQLDAVVRLHAEHPSAWWCMNPFEPEPDGRVYKCSFSHTFFGVDGRIWHAWITPTGRIKRLFTARPEDPPIFKDETDAVVVVYGAFSG